MPATVCVYVLTLCPNAANPTTPGWDSSTGWMFSAAPRADDLRRAADRKRPRGHGRCRLFGRAGGGEGLAERKRAGAPQVVGTDIEIGSFASREDAAPAVRLPAEAGRRRPSSQARGRPPPVRSAGPRTCGTEPKTHTTSALPLGARRWRNGAESGETSCTHTHVTCCASAAIGRRSLTVWSTGRGSSWPRSLAGRVNVARFVQNIASAGRIPSRATS
jgi:hypothetical protein